MDNGSLKDYRCCLLADSGWGYENNTIRVLWIETTSGIFVFCLRNLLILQVNIVVVIEAYEGFALS